MTGFQSLTNKSSLHWNAIKQSRVPIKAKGHKYSAHICVDTVQYVCVYIYMHKYVYVTLQGECHSGLLNCNNPFTTCNSWKFCPLNFTPGQLRISVFSRLDYYLDFSQLTKQGAERTGALILQTPVLPPQAHGTDFCHQIICAFPPLPWGDIQWSFHCHSHTNWSVSIYLVFRENVTISEIIPRSQYGSDKNPGLSFAALLGVILLLIM